MMLGLSIVTQTSVYSACVTPIELSCSLSKDLDSISCWIKRPGNKLQIAA